MSDNIDRLIQAIEHVIALCTSKHKQTDYTLTD